MRKTPQSRAPRLRTLRPCLPLSLPLPSTPPRTWPHPSSPSSDRPARWRHAPRHESPRSARESSHAPVPAHPHPSHRPADTTVSGLTCPTVHDADGSPHPRRAGPATPVGHGTAGSDARSAPCRYRRLRPTPHRRHPRDMVATPPRAPRKAPVPADTNVRPAMLSHRLASGQVAPAASPEAGPHPLADPAG
ncbi:hypothetical protein BOTU111921_29485 [Bordetella tumbae]